MNPLVLSLDTSDITLENAGGKGTNLNRLMGAGFPTPPGFVVTTAAYRAFVHANGLNDRIVALARATRADAPDSFESASQSIRQLFDKSPIPDDIAQPILRAYTHLQTPIPSPFPVAVRSSATAEDLPDASFAGQQETYLNVRDETALMTAVKRCWSSLWTGRAIAYRARQGIAPGAVSLAVVVQQMIPARAAGILFTVNPVTGQRGEVVINAAWGLGEAIVAGQVTPDTVVVDKATLKVKQIEIGDKAVMTTPAHSGTAEVAVEASQRAQAALTPEHAAELARLGVAIESHFGGPQDIEWAIADDKVFILQSRPVTTLPAPTPIPGDDAWPPSDENWPANDFDLWTQADVGERWPEPVTPLTWSTWHVMMNENLGGYYRNYVAAPWLETAQWARRRYGRIYFNEGAMTRLMAHEFGMPASTMTAGFGGQDTRAETRTGWKWGLILSRLPMFMRMTAGINRDIGEYEQRFPQIEAWVDEFMARDLAATTDKALWDEGRTLWWSRAMDNMTLHASVTGASLTNLPMLASMAARATGDKEIVYTLITGLTGVIQAEIVPALRQMAQTAQASGLSAMILDGDPKSALAQLRATPSAQPFLQLLDAFLRRHGHRAVLEAEWLYPRWRESPELVVEMIAGYLRAGDTHQSEPPEAAQVRQREAATAQVEKRLDPISRSLFFRPMLKRVQHIVRMRDNGQHYLVKLALPLRHIYAVLGERWAARGRRSPSGGWLEQPEDFFFLIVPEIEAVLAAGDPSAACLDLRQLVAERRKAYRYWFGVAAPEVLRADGTPFVGAGLVGADPRVGPLPGNILSGVAASAGKVSGTARILASPREASRLHPGDVLVTRATDPGWTPAFSLISGLVLEVGGQLSHGAIVAREYGLPAVVNVPDATRRIRDGQTVTVDGTAGRVYLEGN